MAKTITNGSREGFLLQRTSKFQAENNKLPYYVSTKQVRGDNSMRNAFIYSFDSQINPNLLPESPLVILDKLILTEFNLSITTEVGDYLLIEP